MKIVALKYGESVFGEKYIFKGGSKDKLLPISFVIYLIQLDGKNILVDAGCDDGAGFEMAIFKKPVEVLSEYGLTPNDITDVIITHSHSDHVEAVGYYKNAAIHIQKNEYESARKYIPSDFKIHFIDDEYAVADNVVVKRISGHSIGSCIVLANNYVLCGDECYYKQSLTDIICTGSSYNEEKSMDFIREYRKEKYIQLLFHDPDIIKGRVGFDIIE